MRYLDWLQLLGYDCSKQGITEEEAIRQANPSENPGSEPIQKVNRIVIHHSATSSGNAAFFRVLHRMINRWNDIGYHFVIGNGTFTSDGMIEEGRKLPFTGAHAKGGNEDSIGICLVGNFNDTFPSTAQMKSLATLIRKLMKEHSLSKNCILLHRMVKGSSTECPGKHLNLKEVLYLIDGK